VRIDRAAEFKTTIERSRFFAVAVPADSEADVAAALKVQMREHRRAVHHCWALRARAPDGALLEKSRDDGEVGHPGRVLLELLRRDDVLGALIVSRIFGGVKLGTGGVSRAFRDAGEGALKSTLPPK
jgi:putative IMPACT (imprinted ancient) family translation regulator